MRRMSLGTRLAATFTLLFLLAVTVVVTVVLVLAKQSIDRSNRADSPALQHLQVALADVLNQSGRGDSTDPNAVAQALKKVQAASLHYSAATGNDAVHHLVTWTLVAAGVLLPAAAGLGWWTAGRSLRPLRDVTAAVRRVSESSLSERVGVAGPAEVTELAATFDAMMARLESAFDAQRRFVAGASHELRTPVAVAGAAIDVVLAKPEVEPERWRTMAGDVRDALTRLEDILEGLLALTRAQYLEHRHQPVDVGEVARQVVDDVGESADGIEVNVEVGPAPTRVVGDQAMLERLVANLVDNAIRHNVRPGAVWVRTRTMDGHAVLVVENTGPPVQPDEVAGLLLPFRRRGGRARSEHAGLGLGLAIAVAIAEAHRGSLVAEPRAGGGLRVVVRLPMFG